MAIKAQLQANYLRHVQRDVMPRAQRTIEAFLDRDVPRRTGNMARTRRSQIRNSGNGATLTVGYSSPIANITNDGPRAHVIRPRRRKALRFTVGGRTVFARKVNWRPGAGVARNKRWFSKNTNAARWRTAVGQAVGLG